MGSPKPSTPPILVRRILSHPPEDVFAAWLDPESVRHWMSPFGEARLTGDQIVGGQFSLIMAGDGVEIEHSGRYLVIDPPHLLQFTWRSEFTGGEETLVTLRLSATTDGRTELELTHDSLTVDRRESHEGGWSTIVDRLNRHLEGSGSGHLHDG